MKTTIMDKLQKLLALAENAGTEGEAHAAMNRLQKLCHDHDIEMAEVTIHEEDKDPTADLVFVEEVAGRQTSGWYRWQKDLGVAVSTATGTIILYSGRTIIKFAGDEHDVAVACAFWTQLQSVCRKLARKAIGNGWTSDHKSWAAGFALGCRRKAWADKRESKEKDEEYGGAIVLYRGHKDEWLVKHGDEYERARKPKVKNDQRLAAAGYQEGMKQDMTTGNKLEAKDA